MQPFIWTHGTVGIQHQLVQQAALANHWQQAHASNQAGQQAHASNQAGQQAHASNQLGLQVHSSNQSPDSGIKDVWASNMEEEFKKIREVVQKYPYVAMDTEFPGVVATPTGKFLDDADYQYQTIRCNVDLLRLIQVGLTFYDNNGKSPEPVTTWQFNFSFNINKDTYNQKSIELLWESGLQFKRHEAEGIRVQDFAELLMTSGLVLSPDVKWLVFHGCYDFGYMLRLLRNKVMPVDEKEFFDLLNIYFPNIYDVKYLMKSCRTLYGGLQDVADYVNITRKGPRHQAGSDSLLTGDVFFKMREMFFEDDIDDAKYNRLLYGLGYLYVCNGSNYIYDSHHGCGPPASNGSGASSGTGGNSSGGDNSAASSNSATPTTS